MPDLVFVLSHLNVFLLHTCAFLLFSTIFFIFIYLCTLLFYVSALYFYILLSSLIDISAPVSLNLFSTISLLQIFVPSHLSVWLAPVFLFATCGVNSLFVFSNPFHAPNSCFPTVPLLASPASPSSTCVDLCK